MAIVHISIDIRTEFTDEEFDKILIYLEGGTRFEKAKKLRDLYPLDTADGKRIWVEFLNRQQWCQNEFQVSNQITVDPEPGFHQECISVSGNNIIHRIQFQDLHDHRMSHQR